MKQAIVLALLLNVVVSVAQAESWPYREAMAEAVDHPVRAEANRERDRYRHPAAVLQFFDVQPQMTLVEIWPATGWWTEILGPYTHDKGIYYAAGFATTADNTPQWRRDMQKSFAEKMQRNPEVYDHVVMTELGVPERTTMAPPGTVDRVLTFRNVHNWMKGEYAEGIFTAMYRALKPGGILGVVEHRAKPGTDLETMIRTGYVTEAYVIELAEKAGFSLLERSEINANKKDTTDHPAGVWTLPPSLRHCSSLAEDQQAPCRQKYRAIGESDRMTLKFVKPK